MMTKEIWRSSDAGVGDTGTAPAIGAMPASRRLSSDRRSWQEESLDEISALKIS